MESLICKLQSLSIDMYSFFDTCIYTNNQKLWQGYLKCKYDSWINFYYFNPFFSTYLKYAEGNFKDFYHEIISHTSFRKYKYPKLI
jgi:hypothetical protein